MSGVFALLLMFLHIFVLAAKMTGHATTSVKERLGIYFYIKDETQVASGTTQEEISSRVVKFKDDLEDGGVGVTYFSKDDALKNLQKRLPNMVKNFDEYGIDNPLPVTLYVTFQNQEQYDAIMKKKDNYTDIILANNQTTNAQEQFSRNARVINVLKVLQFFFGFIIVACVVVILLFLGMIIKSKFSAMQHTINVHKLM
jgi:cell division protein FtsX